MVKTAIVLNGSENSNVFPTFVLGSTACAVGNDVIIFFIPRELIFQSHASIDRNVWNRHGGDFLGSLHATGWSGGPRP